VTSDADTQRAADQLNRELVRMDRGYIARAVLPSKIRVTKFWTVGKLPSGREVSAAIVAVGLRVRRITHDHQGSLIEL